MIKVQRVFNVEITPKDPKRLTEEEADVLIAEIVARTRHHPGLARGASVRGSLALREVMQSYCLLHGSTRESLARAAFTTLPHRIMLKEGDSTQVLPILQEILNEVLWGIYPEDDDEIHSFQEGFSQEDVLDALRNLSEAKPGQEPGDTEGRRDMIALVPDDSKKSGDSSSYLLEESQPMDKSWQKAYSQAIQKMLETLEEKFQRGEISEKDFERESRRLKDILNAAKQLQSFSSPKDMAQTVMEMMDAQDKRWQKELKPQDMYVYYHIKNACENKEVSAPKQNWHGLKVVIDYMKQQGVVMPVPEQGFTLTSEALDLLLENLIPEFRTQGAKLFTHSKNSQWRERLQETRRYSQGDVYRDISIRHTLRQIASQRKPLCEVTRRDLRVYLKRSRSKQSDIVLCLDSSGSMGFYQKMIYARLFAAGLARSALKQGDRVGLANFDDVGRSVQPLTDKKSQIFRYIVGTSPGGNTNMSDGIKCAADLLLRQPTHNYKHIVLITDGEPTAISQQAYGQLKGGKDFDATEENSILETRRASLRGIRTSVVHITDAKNAGYELVQKLAQAGGGNIKRVTSVEDIEKAIKS
jgi:Mg-chelatase subunit ChlD